VKTLKELTSEYRKKRVKIKKRLKEFREVWHKSERRIFSELCFCICTPQSKAFFCDAAISRLSKNGKLFSGNLGKIRRDLGGVRFPNNKAKYILEARKLFLNNGRFKIKEKINQKDILKTRHWFVKNVKGLGLKEASHFLRNIGFGRDLAILDVHIIRNILKYGVINKRPKTLTEKKYLSLERKLRKFAENVNIPMDELDLLFWSSETGEIFK